MRAATRFPGLVPGGLVLALVGSTMCAAPNELSDADMHKLDPPLRGLLSGDTTLAHLLTRSQTSDGQVRYAVILRVTDPESVVASGLPVASAAGNIVTARLTLGEIRTAAQLSAVASIETPERRSPGG